MPLLHYLISHPRIAGLLGCNFVLGLATSFVLPFMSLWGTVEVGMTPLVFGLFMTATTLSALVVSLLMARWSDLHGNRRPVMIIGGLGGVFGYVGYAYIRDVGLLMLNGCLVVSLLAVNFSQIAAHLREELALPKNSGAAPAIVMTVLRAFFSLAWTMGPAIGAWIVAGWGYRGVFLSSSGLFAVFLLGVLASVESGPRPSSSASAKRPGTRASSAVSQEGKASELLRPVTTLLRYRHEPIFYYFVVFVLVFCAQVMSMMTLPLFVTQTLGGTTRNVGMLFGLAAFIEIPLMLWFAKIPEHRHALLIRNGVIMACVYFALVPFANAPWHIYPMQFLIAASIAITTNITILFFQDLLPHRKGVATAIYSNTWSMGSLVGYFSFGLLLPALGHRGLYFCCAALTGFGALLLWVRKTPEPAMREA